MTYKDASGKAYTKKIGSRKSTAHLTGLKKFSTYTVTVSAMTEEGLEETSSPVAVTTMEDGQFHRQNQVSFALISLSDLCGDQKIIMSPIRRNHPV